MTGCAILPLVAAAQHGQLPYDALYGVMGGAGLTLVSNLIQQWKDRSDIEEELPAELTEAAAYARHRRQHQSDGDPHNRTLATFIADYLIERDCAPGLPRDFFARLLNSGRGVILLLDGLDGVPDEAEHAQVRQAIESLLAGKPKLRAVVTCRVATYKGRTALGADFREVRVEPLADEHIEALVTCAYDCYFAHDSAQALDKRTELLAGITLLEQQRRAGLGDAAPQLVDSPLMVRLLLIVHLNERRLPQHRAELYQKAVDNLLYPEYSLDEMAAEHLRGLVGGRHEMHRDMVQHVASRARLPAGSATRHRGPGKRARYAGSTSATKTRTIPPMNFGTRMSAPFRS